MYYSEPMLVPGYGMLENFSNLWETYFQNLYIHQVIASSAVIVISY